MNSSLEIFFCISMPTAVHISILIVISNIIIIFNHIYIKNTILSSYSLIFASFIIISLFYFKFSNNDEIFHNLVSYQHFLLSSRSFWRWNLRYYGWKSSLKYTSIIRYSKLPYKHRHKSNERFTKRWIVAGY